MIVVQEEHLRVAAGGAKHEAQQQRGQHAVQHGRRRLHTGATVVAVRCLQRTKASVQQIRSIFGWGTVPLHISRYDTFRRRHSTTVVA